MKRPSAMAAVVASASIASSGFTYAAKDESFGLVMITCAALAVVFAFLGAFAADEA